MVAETGRIDVDSPIWDQGSFYGRFRHFAWMTNPLNGLSTTEQLNNAKTLVEQYKQGQEPIGTTPDQVKNAMKLYKSSFHPDTGDLQNVFGRMTFQVPGGMLVTGAMLQFYQTVPQVLFWQWANQSFNALVNFTNRNAESPISETQLGMAYVSATLSAVGTAVGLKKVLEKSAPPIMQRFVPLCAVGAANCANIPLMRQTEITEGVDLRDKDGNKVCKSTYAAKKGITQVVISRNAIMAPGMLCLPLIMRALEKKTWFASKPKMHLPFQVGALGCFLTFMVPVGCALFPQMCEIEPEKLKQVEPQAYEEMRAKYKSEEDMPKMLFFNKGL